MKDQRMKISLRCTHSSNAKNTMNVIMVIRIIMVAVTHAIIEVTINALIIGHMLTTVSRRKKSMKPQHTKQCITPTGPLHKTTQTLNRHKMTTPHNLILA